MTRRRRIAILAFALYAIGVTYGVTMALLRIEPPHWILTANTLAFFIFAVAHAGDHLGTRAMLTFLGITFAVSFAFETVGVLTGLIYGSYYYTERLGVKLGVVPVLIPLAWFMMMYASYTLVEIIAGGVSARGTRALIGSAWFAFLGAMAMTAWDLGMDPQMVARGHWVWTQGGAYFGIPVRNFVGWLATTFVVFFLFRVYAVTQPPRAARFADKFSLLPIAAYAIQGLATIIVGAVMDQRAPALVTFFAMGAFLFVAATQVARERLGVASEG